MSSRTIVLTLKHFNIYKIKCKCYVIKPSLFIYDPEPTRLQSTQKMVKNKTYSAAEQEYKFMKLVNNVILHENLTFRRILNPHTIFYD